MGVVSKKDMGKRMTLSSTSSCKIFEPLRQAKFNVMVAISTKIV